MIKVQLLISYLIAFVFSGSLWVPKLVGEDLKLERGFYKKFNLTFEGDSYGVYGFLTITDDDGKSLLSENDAFQIDTHQSTTYEVYIGVPCSFSGSQVKATVEVVGENSDYFEKGDFNFKIEEQSNRKLVLNVPMPEVPTFTYSYVIPDKHYYNVEGFYLIFNQTSQAEGVKIEELYVSSYYKSLEKENLRFSTKLISEHYYDKDTEVTFSVEMKSSSKCYDVQNKTLTFTLTDGSYANLERIKGVKESIIKGLLLRKPDKLNEIWLQAYIPQTPVLLSCVAQRFFKDFPSDDEIRGQKEDDSSDKRFAQYFITDEASINIKFKEISRLGGFKAKCVVDNTASSDGDKQNITFTVGAFSGSEKYIDLTTYTDEPLYGHCATWTFEDKSISQIKTFSEKAVKFANVQINKLSEKLWKDNGCPIFIQREENVQITKENQGSICLIAASNCSSTYERDSDKDFKEIIGQIKDKEGISKNLGIDMEIKGDVFFETDNLAPDKEKIKVTLSSLERDLITVNVMNQEDSPIGCVIKGDIVYRDADTVISYADFGKTESLYINRNTNNSQQINIFGEGYSKEILVVQMFCHFIPGSNFHSHQTDPFVAAAFYDIEPNHLPKEYQEKRLNCNGKELTPECIDLKAHKPIKFESFNPKDDNDEYDIKYFNKLSNVEQKGMLDYRNETLYKRSTSSRDFLGEIIYISQLLGYRDCKTNINYEECGKDKKSIYKSALDIFFKIFPKGQLVNKLNEKVAKEVGGEIAVKMLIQAVFFLTNNPDCIDSKETFDSLFNLVSEVVDNMSKILETLNYEMSQENHLDVIKTAIASTVNLVDIISYAESLGFIKASNESFFVVLDKEYPKKQINLTEKIVQYLWGYEGDGVTFANDAFVYDVVKKKNLNSGLKSKLRMTDVEIPHKIQFYGYGVEISFKAETLFEEHGGDLIHTYIYKKFPSMSNANSVISENFVGMSIFKKEKNKNTYVKLKASGISKNHYPKVNYTLEQQKLANISQCYYFDDVKSNLTLSNIKTSSVSNSSITCELKAFGEFTVGKKKLKESNLFLILAIIGGVVILFIIIFIVYFLCRRRKKGVENVLESESKDVSPLVGD